MSQPHAGLARIMTIIIKQTSQKQMTAVIDLDKVSKTGVSTACFSRRFAMPLYNVLTQQLDKCLYVELKR